MLPCTVAQSLCLASTMCSVLGTWAWVGGQGKGRKAGLTSLS